MRLNLHLATGRAAIWGILATLLAWICFTLFVAVRSLDVAPVADLDGVIVSMPRHDATRPTAVVLLSQAGTEVTDFLAPYAILAASGHFNVYAAAGADGVAPTNGGLGILPQLTLAEFDQLHPNGADVVVIPNVLDPENPLVLDWVRQQASKGALSVSICEGARVLARTGLLEGREATTHFAAVGELRRAHPEARWRDDVRYVVDGPIVMSAGVTAAVDASLYLVGRFADAATAERTRALLQLPTLDKIAAAAPVLGFANVAPGVLNVVLGWPKTQLHVPLYDGIDEIELSAVLDAYSRTFAATTVTTTAERRSVTSRFGLTFVPMRASAATDAANLVTPARPGSEHGFAFDRALRGVAQRFGGATAQLVAIQLQYPASHLELAKEPNPWLGRVVVAALVLACGVAIGIGLWAARRRWATRSGRSSK